MIRIKQSRPTRFVLALVAALLVAAALATSPAGAAAQDRATETTTVMLVRHAEKAAAGDPEFAGASATDPPLTAAGRARADALAQTLAEAGVTAVYASQFQRTQLTVRPLAEALGLEVQQFPAADVAGIAELVTREHAGGVVVIAGHSNTVPALVEALGAGAVAPIEESWEYDNLYVVSIDGGGSARVVTLKFGAPSRPGARR